MSGVINQTDDAIAMGLQRELCGNKGILQFCPIGNGVTKKLQTKKYASYWKGFSAFSLLK